MAGIFILDGFKRRLRDSRRQKKLTLAHSWPTATAQINHWSVLPVEEDHASFSSGFQIEAGFHFTLNGEYYGGYARSTSMSSTAAEKLSTGNPAIVIRYNPANPDETAVLAEDNSGKAPFDILPG